MQIKKLDTYQSFQNGSVLKKPVTKQSNVSTPGSLSLQEISSNKIRAAYLPAFGCYKKVGEATLKEKATGKPVTAEIHSKADVDNYKLYRLVVDKQEAGKMDIALNEPFPGYNEKLPKYKNPIPYKEFPKVIHIRSILGDKYSGIGSTLINIAIEESKKSGKNGALWLNARKGYLKNVSKYRSDENPIPFYYKLGFRALGKKDKKIQKYLETKDYEKLPSSQVLILTPKAASANNKYLTKNFTFNENENK